MKYATWKLNFENSDYGTGPEPSIVEQGGTAEGAYTDGNIAAVAKILGYFTGEPTGLETWGFQEVSQQQALHFVLATNPDAYLLEDGRIVAPIPQPPIIEPS